MHNPLLSKANVLYNPFRKGQVSLGTEPVTSLEEHRRKQEW